MADLPPPAHPAGPTLREVQEQTGQTGKAIPFTTLAKVEQGRVDPGVMRLHQLLRLYNVPVQMAAELLDLEQWSDEHVRQLEPEVLEAEGLSHWKKGDLKKALGYLYSVRESSSENANARLERQKTLLSFAVAAGTLGKYHLSRQIADDLLVEPPDPSLLVPVLLQLGVCWLRLGSPEAALAFLERAERHVRPKDLLHRAWILHQKAATLAATDELDEAEAELTKAIQAYRKAGDAQGENRALGVRIKLLRKQGRHADALKSAGAGRTHAEGHGFDRLTVLRRLDEGRAHVDLGEPATGIPLLREALASAISQKDQMAEFRAHHALWKAYQAAGDGERADLELKAALYFVRFVDESTEEVAEIRRPICAAAPRAENRPALAEAGLSSSPRTFPRWIAREALRAAGILYRVGLQASSPPGADGPRGVLEDARLLAEELTEAAEQAAPAASRMRFSAGLALLHVAVVLAGRSAPHARAPPAPGALSGELLPTQPWRLVASLLLHADLLHAAWNGLALVAFGVPVMERFGLARAAGIYLGAGLGGGLLAVLQASPATVFLGASGAISGLFGAWLVDRVGRLRRRRTRRDLVRVVGIGLLYLPALLNPVTPQGGRISVAAHLGGLVAGALLTWGFLHRERRETSGERSGIA
jgi:membrane associated rhomboid family serine protease/tetratricopeptide (TPR) repeat protein